MTTNNIVNVGLSGSTGTGNFVGATSPTLITPALGTPAAGSSAVGVAGTGYGGGAAGAWSDIGTTNRNGAAGQPGIIVAYEYS